MGIPPKLLKIVEPKFDILNIYVAMNNTREKIYTKSIKNVFGYQS